MQNSYLNSKLQKVLKRNLITLIWPILEFHWWIFFWVYFDQIKSPLSSKKPIENIQVIVSFWTHIMLKWTFIWNCAMFCIMIGLVRFHSPHFLNIILRIHWLNKSNICWSVLCYPQIFHEFEKEKRLADCPICCERCREWNNNHLLILNISYVAMSFSELFHFYHLFRSYKTCFTSFIRGV